MMGKSYILAHDLGTTGNKATLWADSGELTASTFFGYRTFFPRPLWVEQDPNEWWNAVVGATKNLLEQTSIAPGSVAAISFSGQMMGCVPVDAQGNPLGRSIIWSDARAVEEARFINQQISPEKMYELTGTPAVPNYTLAKIMWLKKNCPETYKKASFFLQAKDYIVFRLTGKVATDYSDASTTNLFGLEKKKWLEEIAEVAGIDLIKLPPAYSSSTVVGGLRSEIANQLGLLPGTPIVIGGGDGACATVGAGAVQEAETYCYLGSSAWIAFVKHVPIFDKSARTFVFCHPDPELYVNVGTMQAAGISYEWLGEVLCPRSGNEDGGGNVYDTMNHEAQRVTPGARGLLFLPYLLGERSPYWNPNARGAFIGLSRTHDRRDLIRSVLEGIAFNLGLIFEALVENGAAIKEITLIGGMAKNNLFCEILTNVFGRPVYIPSMVNEATSLGAAIIGGVGIGLFESLNEVHRFLKIENSLVPDNRLTDFYREVLLIFKDAYMALAKIFDRIVWLQDL